MQTHNWTTWHLPAVRWQAGSSLEQWVSQWWPVDGSLEHHHRTARLPDTLQSTGHSTARGSGWKPHHTALVCGQDKQNLFFKWYLAACSNSAVSVCTNLLLIQWMSVKMMSLRTKAQAPPRPSFTSLSSRLTKRWYIRRMRWRSYPLVVSAALSHTANRILWMEICSTTGDKNDDNRYNNIKSTEIKS